MKIIYDKNGVYIKKLFNSFMISYKEIRSVVLSNEEYIITTNNGEIFKEKIHIFSNYSALYEAIKKYNIYFRDEEELEANKNVYSIAEVDEKMAQMLPDLKEYACNSIHEKMGAEYDIDLLVIDENQYVDMHIRLLKNGELVKDYPEMLKCETTDSEPYSYDSMVVAFLLEWDGNGRYGVTNEMNNKELCEEYLEESLNHLVKYYKK